MDAIIFIDTNILLDFYRIRSSDISLSYLELIDNNHDKIITGNQIEMEFKKNRQKVILESIGKIKTPNWESLTPPAILSDAKPSDIIEKKKKEIAKQHKKLRDRILKILKSPATSDPVYQTLQRLFKDDTDLNLNRNKKIRYTIRNLAKKRFILGYPPRKKEDNSIGDAYNWEWILKCAEDTGKNVIIVTRDSDYGVIYDKEGILNDWLMQEFKERISRKRKIILTDRLAWAFDQIKVTVTKEMIEEEERLIALFKDSLSTPKEAEELRELIDFIDKIKFENK